MFLCRPFISVGVISEAAGDCNPSVAIKKTAAVAGDRPAPVFEMLFSETACCAAFSQNLSRAKTGAFHCAFSQLLFL